MAEAFIALGGNVGDVRATFDRAIAMLCDGAVVRLAARSSDYRTPPWGVTDQPPFVNAVIAVATSLAPHDLFARAEKCERALGRDRTHERRWGPRTIDIDLLAYDDLVLDEPDLTLAAPAAVRARLRARAARRDCARPRHRRHPGARGAGRVDTSGIEKLPPR